MQANIESTLATLVSIPSLSEDSAACHEILNFVLDEIKTYDLFIQSDFEQANPWLLATTQNTKTPHILLCAHLDVIPAPSAMFHMRKRDGKLYGRGVFDMKFAAACYLEFLRVNASRLHELNIGFLFTTDEEKNSATMPEILATGLRPNVAFIPDGGDNWLLEKRAKGFYGIELSATGKTAHGSRPWEGKSALHTLLDAIQPLREKYPYKDKHEPTFMVNSIQSGHAFNQIPDYASAQLDFRCFNAHELQECRSYIADLVEKYDLTLTIRHSGSAIDFDDQSPYVQGFLRALEEVTGTPPQFSDSYGGTDARFYMALGIPSIVIEPHGGGRHGSDEWVQAADLAKYYRLIERWITQEQEAKSR
jgi:acetylornithine deacetylase/succinyl-diaminopimelate desuccinylase-like protein